MSGAAIIVAAGEGRRMGFDKLLAPIHGKPVLQWSVEAFLQAPSIEQIVVVAPPARFEQVAMDANSPVRRVDGGAERHLSVANGLAALEPGPTVVAVHDAARPCIHPDAIESCLAEARRTGAAALAHRVTETLKRADDHGLTSEPVSRDNLWTMETPQCFSLELLQRAYDHLGATGLTVTDEVSALEAIGVATLLVDNPRPNPKITVSSDLPLAEAILAGPR